MSDFICEKYSCPNRTSLGYCALTACSYCCPNTRWTDKLSVDSEGNIRDFYGNIIGHYELSNLNINGNPATIVPNGYVPNVTWEIKEK